MSLGTYEIMTSIETVSQNISKSAKSHEHRLYNPAKIEAHQRLVTWNLEIHRKWDR